MKTRAMMLAWVQKILYSLAVLASMLLVVDIAAPWLLSKILAPFGGFLQALPDIEANTITYLLSQVLVVIGLLLFIRFFNAKTADLGIGKMRHWYLILLTPLIFVVYMALTIAFSILISIIFPEYNPTEKQEIGLSPESSHNLVLTAIFLSIFVPLAEEFAFRGYLFGLLRRRLSFATVAILVSLAFAILHMLFDNSSGVLVVKHVNVAIDVFTLSLFLCYLREKTQSIWASVVLHGLKNFIAFLYLFIYNVG